MASSALLSTWTTCAALPPIDPELEEQPITQKHAKIGAYQLTRKLGVGEFANVYECMKRGEDRATAKKYAFKAIKKARVQRHAQLHKAKRNIKRVDTEVASMKKLSHGAVVRLYDVIQSPTMLYIVLEKGDRDLYSFLDSHEYADGCPDDVVKSVMRIAALGLRHCHANGVAHRDLKPENILVVGQPGDWSMIEENDDPCKRGVVKLCDFGLCADVSSGENLTDFVGSPCFFAPEILLDGSYDGRAADVWSLGCVMLEMLLGHAAFSQVWCPPYDQLKNDDKFRAAIHVAVQEVKAGCTECTPSPLYLLLDKILELQPYRRISIEDVCQMEYFDLMQTSPNGHSKMLRMTYDKMRQSFGPGGSPTKPLQRRQRITRISQNPREEQIVVADTNVNDLCNTNVNELCKMPSRPVWQPNVARPTPSTRRCPRNSIARWRGDSRRSPHTQLTG